MKLLILDYHDEEQLQDNGHFSARNISLELCPFSNFLVFDVVITEISTCIKYINIKLGMLARHKGYNS